MHNPGLKHLLIMLGNSCSFGTSSAEVMCVGSHLYVDLDPFREATAVLRNSVRCHEEETLTET